jgi:4-carboxymuconolactone decarboxylase
MFRTPFRSIAFAAAVAALAVEASIAAQSTIAPPGDKKPVVRSTPRVQPLPEAQWTDAHRQLVEKYARYGKPDNAFKTFLNVPEMTDGVMPYTIYLSMDTSLTPRQREILILRAAWLCGNEAVWAQHAARARDAGMNNPEIHRIGEGASAAGWDAFEATLLRMADELYRNSSVTDATWKALTATYDMQHMMEAVETFNHFTVLSMLYNSFGVQPENGLPDRLPTGVPYRVNVPKREPPLAKARYEPPAGRGIAVGRTFAMHPTLSRAWSPRQSFINQHSPLMPRHREMLILRMGWDCRSEYEWAQHVGRVGRAREHGLDPLKIAEGPKAQGWEPIERTILTAADELFHDTTVSDATWNALVSAFDTKWAMSALFTSSGYRAISMSLNTYGVQHDEGDERFPVISGR